MPRLARGLYAGTAIAAASLGACAPPWRGGSPDREAAMCPRDAVRGVANRCVCAPGRELLMGACVTPTLGDAFCGLAERSGPDGCSFRTCSIGQRLDVASGTCESAWGLASCGEHELPLLESGQVSCVHPDATCPRGSRRTGGACARPPSCPPGSLPDRGSCRAVVTAGARGLSVVDVGAWMALVIGIDGGLGTASLCQPLAQRPAVFSAAADGPLQVDIQVTVILPDQDVSALSARIVVTDPGGLPLPPAAEAVATEATTTLLELLRSLGGESSAAAVGVRVRCDIGVR
jgi:hypothetical protein